MTQDTTNQPSVEEEPQISDQNLAPQTSSADLHTTTETQIAEPVTEENEDEFADEADETEAASSEETTEAETSSANDSADSVPSSVTQSTSPTPQVDKDDRCEIEKQPYHFDQCTVQIAIQLLPDDGDANGRMVVVGVRSHLDSPLLRLVRLNQLGTLPPLVSDLLDALKTELPVREQAAREAFEKKKEERAQHKAAITASKTARGKKTKPTLATVPASSNATTDNRPRPEVQVTTSPQQQMGLF